MTVIRIKLSLTMMFPFRVAVATNIAVNVASVPGKAWSAA